MREVASGDTEKSIPAKDVDSYLAALPEETRAALEDLRRIIKAAAPEAQEAISWGMPAFKQNGVLVFYAAFKNHCSLFMANRATAQAFADELKPYETNGTTIHFTAKKPLPAELVQRIVKARLEENELRARSKRK